MSKFFFFLLSVTNCLSKTPALISLLRFSPFCITRRWCTMFCFSFFIRPFHHWHLLFLSSPLSSDEINCLPASQHWTHTHANDPLRQRRLTRTKEKTRSSSLSVSLQLKEFQSQRNIRDCQVNRAMFFLTSRENCSTARPTSLTAFMR